MTGTSATVIRWAGFAAGCALGVFVVLGGRVPEGGAAAPARLAVSAQPTAQLGVAPAGLDFLRSRSLRPGGPAAHGALELTNYATRPLAVRMRLQPGNRDLDALVRVTVAADKKGVFRGTLSELRSRSAVRFGMRPEQRRRLVVRAWLPRSAGSEFQGRSARLELGFKTAGQGG